MNVDGSGGSGSGSGSGSGTNKSRIPPVMSTPEDRPPGWSQRIARPGLSDPFQVGELKGGGGAGAAGGGGSPKKNRFAMSARKQGKLRSRYVDTFSANSKE